MNLKCIHQSTIQTPSLIISKGLGFILISLCILFFQITKKNQNPNSIVEISVDKDVQKSKVLVSTNYHTLLIWSLAI